MQALFRAEEPNHSRRIIRVFEWKIIRCAETGPSKQASLRNSARSLIERRAEPLGNLNKGLPSAPRVAYPLMRHVHASHHITSHHITSHHITAPGGAAAPLGQETRGPPLISSHFLHPVGTPTVASPTDKEPGTGGPPLLSGSQTPEAAGRCHYPGAVSTVAAGAGPFLSPRVVSPLLHHPPAPVGPTGNRGGFGSPHVQELDPPSRDAPVQNMRSA